MRPHFTKLIATLLLGVFSVFLIPKEFVHALFEHKDTIEHVNLEGAASFSKHHTHCDFLSYEASLFTLSSITNIPVSSNQLFNCTCFEQVHAGIVILTFPSLRGPPLSC